MSRKERILPTTSLALNFLACPPPLPEFRLLWNLLFRTCVPSVMKPRKVFFVEPCLEQEGVVLEQVEGLHSFSFRIKPGLRFPLYTAAPGKLFLAHMSEDERAAYLEGASFEKFTPNTLTSASALMKEVKQAGIDGFAFDREEEMIGQVCVASGVFNRSGRLIGAIWMVAPSSRVLPYDLPPLAEKVRECAERISLTFGYSKLRAA